MVTLPSPEPSALCTHHFLLLPFKGVPQSTGLCTLIAAFSDCLALPLTCSPAFVLPPSLLKHTHVGGTLPTPSSPIPQPHTSGLFSKLAQLPAAAHSPGTYLHGNGFLCPGLPSAPGLEPQPALHRLCSVLPVWALPTAGPVVAPALVVLTALSPAGPQDTLTSCECSLSTSLLGCRTLGLRGTEGHNSTCYAPSVPAHAHMRCPPCSVGGGFVQATASTFQPIGFSPFSLWKGNDFQR